MKKYVLLNLLCAFFLLSCIHRNPLVLEAYDVDYLDKTGDVIYGNKMNLEVMGISNIVVYDSLLMFLTMDPSGFLQVYNKNTLEHLGSFCHPGRARNEFAGSAFLINNQYYLKNKDLILPLVDFKTFIQKEINVSASIREGHTVVENVESRTTDCMNSVLLGNGLEKVFTYTNPVFNPELQVTSLPVYSIKENNELVKEIKVFRRHVECEIPDLLQGCYYGGMVKHPNRNLVVITMGSMDYLFFFDFDKNKYYALHQTGTPSASEIMIYKDENKNRPCFGLPLVDYSADRFLVFYFGGKHTEEAIKEEEMRGELLLYDWDGNYLGGVKLDNNFIFASYDSEKKMLYTVNILDEIYTYDLSEFMNSLDK